MQLLDKLVNKVKKDKKIQILLILIVFVLFMFVAFYPQKDEQNSSEFNVSSYVNEL